MDRSEQMIKGYLRKLDPKIFGLDGIKSIRIKRIGLGESNLNYLTIINGKKFIVRINMDPRSLNKSKKEYNSLRIVEHLGIAPKVFHLETSKKCLGETFIILEYLEGKSLEECKKVDKNTLRKLGRIVAQLHNTSIDNIRKHMGKIGSSKTDILNDIRIRIDYIKTKRKIYFKGKREFEDVLTNSYRRLQQLKFDSKPYYILGHGDIAPQNVIISAGKELKLIDWEDLGLIDPAYEIAIIFDSFDFSDRQKELFLEEYSKVKKYPDLRKRIPLFWLLQLFSDFCWAIMHVYEIGEEEMHESFLREQNLKEHIDYAKKMFQKCKKEGIIDKNARWDASKIFPEKYLKTHMHAKVQQVSSTSNKN